MYKFLFIASSISYGGAEKMICFVANGLSKKGYEVTLVNMQEKEGEEQQLDDRINYIKLRRCDTRYVARIKQLCALIRIIKQEKPTEIISFKYIQNYIAVLLGKIFNIPVIVSERADPTKEDHTSIKGRIYWNLINKADGGVFQTVYAQKCYKKRLRDRGTVISNPVFNSSNKRVSDRKNEHIIVSIGRLDNAQKRYDLMIEAFAEFHKLHPEYYLHLYGNGPDEAEIRKMIAELSIDNAVILMGYTNNTSDILSTCESFIITSDYEGISNALLEAMAEGVPVISTDSTPGGARMLINNNENGLLVAAGDIGGIKNAMVLYAENEALRKKCGNNAKYVLDCFAPSVIINQWENYAIDIIQEYKNIQ